MPLPLPADIRRRIGAFDAAVDRLFDRARGNPSADRVMYALSEVADYSLLWQVVAAARGLRSARHEREWARLAAGLLAESVVVNGVVKTAFGRRRPHFPGQRPHPLRQPRTSSFPSGHASSAFFAAGLLAERNPWWPLYYVAAAAVASTRVYVKIHHASDVVAGAVTGAVLARIARRVWTIE